MSVAQAMVSVGDEGVLNARVSPSLADVWIDRDLSWLDFNERVPAEAIDDRTPLLERVKFLAIFTANLDEFFMKRIAVLHDTLAPECLQLLEQIPAKLLPMLQQQSVHQQVIRLQTGEEINQTLLVLQEFQQFFVL